LEFGVSLEKKIFPEILVFERLFIEMSLSNGKSEERNPSS